MHSPVPVRAFALLAVMAAVPAALCAQNAAPLPDAPSPAPEPPAPVSAPTPAAPDSAPEPPAPVTVLEDTPLTLQVLTPIVTGDARDGDDILLLVAGDVRVGDVLAIPRGATVHGTVAAVKRSGTLTGAPELTLKLVSLELGGRSYPLYSHLFRVKGLSKTHPTEKKVVGGAVIGALIGGINMSKGTGVSSGNSTGAAATPSSSAVSPSAAGMGVGAAAGAGVGTAVAAISSGPVLRIPSEAEVEFSLASPITIKPVSAKEAARLAEGLNPGGPTLYVRGETP